MLLYIIGRLILVCEKVSPMISMVGQCVKILKTVTTVDVVRLNRN